MSITEPAIETPTQPREEPPAEPPSRPKTTEEKAQLVDGVRAAARTHAQAVARRIRLEAELATARREEAVSLEALQASRRTLKLEAEATDP